MSDFPLSNCPDKVERYFYRSVDRPPTNDPPSGLVEPGIPEPDPENIGQGSIPRSRWQAKAGHRSRSDHPGCGIGYRPRPKAGISYRTL